MKSYVSANVGWSNLRSGFSSCTLSSERGYMCAVSHDVLDLNPKEIIMGVYIIHGSATVARGFGSPEFS